MALKIYYDTPFVSSNEVDEYATFTTDGSTDTFTCANSDNSRVGATIQYNSTQKFLYGGGFVKNNDGASITINTVPAANLQGVLPGLSALVLSAYDQSVVEGVSTPRVATLPFYIYDDEINIYKYKPRSGQVGIELFFVDNITSTGPDLTWVQLASADASGNALTYAATGETLYTAELTAFSTLSASAAQGATSITVDSGTNFFPGDYIILNVGGSSAETIKISSRSGTTINLATATNFVHYSEETVYACARKFWIKMTVPEDYADGQAQNYYDLGLRIRAVKQQR